MIRRCVLCGKLWNRCEGHGRGTLVAFLVLLPLLLNGCASDPYWVRTEVFEPKEIQVHDVDVSPWGPSVQGYTIRDSATGICHVVMFPSRDRECVLRHEIDWHCRGWDHPSYRYNLSCMHITSLIGAYHGTAGWLQ